MFCVSSELDEFCCKLAGVDNLRPPGGLEEALCAFEGTCAVEKARPCGFLNPGW